MKKLIALMVVAALLLAAGCAVQEAVPSEQGDSDGPVESLMPETLEELLAYTSRRRNGTDKPGTTLVETPEWNSGEVSPLEFPAQGPDFDSEALFAPAQIKEDLDLLFSWLESMYGPYYLFGGREAFEFAYDRVLDDLRVLPRLTGDDLEQSLLSRLSFVRDAHFRINWQATAPDVYGYITEGEGFVRDGAGFACAVTGDTVDRIGQNESWYTDMVLSLTPQGELRYQFLALSDTEPEAVDVKYQNGKEEARLLVNVHQQAGSARDEDEPVKLEYVEDIPVLRVGFMGFDHVENDYGANLFLQYAEELKEEPVLIIDLRDNPGGNGLLPQKWLERYTGEIVPTNYVQLRRYDFYEAVGIAEDEGQSESTFVPMEEMNYYADPKRVNESWGVQDALEDRVVPNDRLVVVLVNKGTGSAADIFVDLMFNLENTLVVGSNTAGQLLSNAFVGITLPNTGLMAQMGNTVSLFPEDHFEEYTGFLPDLWVTGDAEEAVMALLRGQTAA